VTQLGFSEDGIPIFDVKDKVEALQECPDGAAVEDALGHIGDLFHHALNGFNRSLVEDDGCGPWSVRIAAEEWIISLNPTPIIGPTVLDRIVKELGDSSE